VIFRDAIAEKYKPARLELIPTTHSEQNAEKVVSGSFVIFTDVSPTIKDEEKLQQCRGVIIEDRKLREAKYDKRRDLDTQNAVFKEKQMLDSMQE
jgi:hypothetical protein